MPIRKDWNTASKTHIQNNAPASDGIYELQCDGELVYIGKATNIRNRLLEHCSERDPDKYRFREVGRGSSCTRLENKHLTRYEEDHGSLPRWNASDMCTCC